MIKKLKSHIKNSIVQAEIHCSKLNAIDYRFVPKHRVLNMLSPTRSDGSFDAEILIPKELPKEIEVRAPGTEVLKLAGMSSQKTRHFLNNLCSIKDWPINYLEIGVWAGSTFLASGFMNDNSINKMVAIDNFSQFNEEDIKTLFLSNVLKNLGLPEFDVSKVKLFEENCFELDVSTLGGPFNVYFYDGPHSLKDTEMSLTYYDSILDDVFIYIVDDWQEDEIQEGAKKAIKKLGYKIHYEISLHGKGGSNSKQKVDSVPYYEHWRDEYWQGQYVAILEKSNSWWQNEKITEDK